MDFSNNSLGTSLECGMQFPYYHTQSIHDGLVSGGERDVVMLTRSAWAGAGPHNMDYPLTRWP